jgi:DNA-directed RNA polymerase I subunit RPA1
MTLNTFHLAGHGGVNMTLGIPRLREILMTSENNIKTPIMTIPCYSRDIDAVKKLARRFEKYSLIDIVKEIDIKRSIAINENDNRKKRIYQINISFEEFKLIQEYFKMDESEIKRIFKINFIPNLAKTVNKYLKLSNKKGEVISNRQKEKIEEEVEEENFEINKRKKSLSDKDESGDEEDTTKKEDTEDDFYYMEINKSNMDTEEDHTGTNTMTLRDETNEDTNQDRDENESENAESVDEEGNVENLNLGSKKQNKEKKTKQAKENAADNVDKKEFRFEEVFVYNMDIELNDDNSYFKFDIAVPFTLKTILLKK